MIIETTLFAYKALFFIYTAYNYFKYKPVTSVKDDELPTCTVIVPAYNEGKQVWDTLMILADSDYPECKIQLLAIDDGSLDDTWNWMLKAKEKLGWTPKTSFKQMVTEMIQADLEEAKRDSLCQDQGFQTYNYHE